MEQRRRITRSTDRKVAGVCAGIAEYLDVDPTLVRLAVVVMALAGVPWIVLAYVVLWIVLPESDGTPVVAASTGSPDSRNLLLVVIGVLVILALAGSMRIGWWWGGMPGMMTGGWGMGFRFWPLLLLIGLVMLLFARRR